MCACNSISEETQEKGRSSLGITEEPRRNDGSNEVEDCIDDSSARRHGNNGEGERTGESEQDPNISPPVGVFNVEGLEEVFSPRVLAVCTLVGGVGIFQVPAESSHKLPGPLLTCLARRRSEPDELVGLASDDQTTEDDFQYDNPKLNT